MMITFLSIQCLLPILYKHANIINSFHYIIGIYGQPPYNLSCVNMETYRSRRKLFAPKPCVAARFSHKVPPFHRLALQHLQPGPPIYKGMQRCSKQPQCIQRIVPAVGERPPDFNMKAESPDRLHSAIIYDYAVCQRFSIPRSKKCQKSCKIFPEKFGS